MPDFLTGSCSEQRLDQVDRAAERGRAPARVAASGARGQAGAPLAAGTVGGPLAGPLDEARRPATAEVNDMSRGADVMIGFRSARSGRGAAARRGPRHGSRRRRRPHRPRPPVRAPAGGDRRRDRRRHGDAARRLERRAAIERNGSRRLRRERRVAMSGDESEKGRSHEVHFWWIPRRAGRSARTGRGGGRLGGLGGAGARAGSVTRAVPRPRRRGAVARGRRVVSGGASRCWSPSWQPSSPSA